MGFISYLADWMEDTDWDRTKTNDSDGQTFYGSDNDDGTTTWYDEDGHCDSTTSTPCDEDDD